MKNEGGYKVEFAGALNGEEDTADNGKQWVLAKLPAFLNSDDWEDISWHNDECPRFTNKKLGIDLWVNFLGRDDGYKNYAIDNVDKKGEYKNTPLCTDYLCEVSAYVAKREKKYTEGLTTRLAKTFSKELRKVLTKGEFRSVIALNNKEKDKQVCHSHDFIDANMVMDAAFTMVFKKQLDVQNTTDSAFFNSAWNLAKKSKFFVKASK